MPEGSYDPNSFDAILTGIHVKLTSIADSFTVMRNEMDILQTSVNELQRFKYATVIICSSAMVVISAFAVAIAEHVVGK